MPYFGSVSGTFCDLCGLCRVEIASAEGRVLRSFGLDECPGAPHEARIVRRAALTAALRSVLPEEAVRYGCSVADVRATEQGVPCPSVRYISCDVAALHALTNSRWPLYIVVPMIESAKANMQALRWS